MLILGSLSPRRKEILSYFKIPFTQVPSPFEESSYLPGKSPAKYVVNLAKLKGKALLAQYPYEIILSCDTIVYFNGKILEKPNGRNDAKEMLQSLSEKWHTVYTGVSVRQGERIYSGYETTRVKMSKLSDTQLDIYLDSQEWSDKAGGYGIQQKGSLLVTKIQGCFYNVMGFPVQTVNSLLNQFNIDLWETYLL